jgi:hypothetical protein
MPNRSHDAQYGFRSSHLYLVSSFLSKMDRLGLTFLRTLQVIQPVLALFGATGFRDGPAPGDERSSDCTSIFVGRVNKW